MSSHNHTWRSADRHLGARMAYEHLARMLRWCQHAGVNETGGILAGYYTAALDQAIITRLSSAPEDSREGRVWFSRGTQGLQSWLDHLWRAERHYYLGEWHYHPFAPPHPSNIDQAQMQRIARDTGYHCPEPLLIIVGGNSSGLRQVRVFVYSNTNYPIELYLENAIAFADISPGLQPTASCVHLDWDAATCYSPRTPIGSFAETRGVQWRQQFGKQRKFR